MLSIDTYQWQHYIDGWQYYSKLHCIIISKKRSHSAASKYEESLPNFCKAPSKQYLPHQCLTWVVIRICSQCFHSSLFLKDSVPNCAFRTRFLREFGGVTEAEMVVVKAVASLVPCGFSPLHHQLQKQQKIAFPLPLRSVLSFLALFLTHSTQAGLLACTLVCCDSISYSLDLFVVCLFG